MRLPTEYELYLFRMNKYYKNRQLDQPAWIESALEQYEFIYNSKRELSMICSNTTIPKAKMDWLASIKKISYHEIQDLPEELLKETVEAYECLSELYNELMNGKDEYFLNEWTLTKKGRKKMREYIDKIPSVENLKPPKNSFTNDSNNN